VVGLLIYESGFAVTATARALCHSPTLTAGGSISTGMSRMSYNPYSDFALHQMGTGVSDGIPQGAAGPDQFRTAPLWGLGQRLFFLHDGRSADLIQAIHAHTDLDQKPTRSFTTSLLCRRPRCKTS
jgi:CxxC motif-containing protein (DUF1111 family)